MPRIFLSHSSEDNRAATALRQWLVAQDSSLDDDIFLDIDPRNGMVGGAQWKKTLLRKLASSEALLCLVSQSWEARPECVHEYRGAEDAGKQIFCARLEPSAGASVSAWQWRDVFVDDGHDITEVDIGDGRAPLGFAADGLDRLLRDVQTPDLGPRSFPWPPPSQSAREPYRGWLPFESCDAGVFFGRDTEIARALKTLRDIADDGFSKLFVVLGASGTGKSSLLRAGLLPRLRQERRRFAVLGTIRPGRGKAVTGDMGLASAIFDGRRRVGLTSPPLGEIKNQWVHDTAKVRQLLSEILQQEDRQLDSDDGSPMLVVAVDQAEELFSAEAGQEGAALLAMLRDLMAGSQDGQKLPLITVVTIRTDRYAVMQTAPEVAGMEIAFDDLRPMPLGRFREVIEGPAMRSTEGGHPLAIDNSLMNHLFAEAANITAGGDSLPLLSLTLHRMYLDYSSSGRLTLGQYDEMGGMANVVRNEIKRLLSKDVDVRREELELLKDAFVPWLATVSDDNQPMRRIALWSDIPEASREVVSRFIDARLLTRGRGVGVDASEYQDVVEVALESLLRQWPDLAQWLSEQRDDLKATDHLIREASAWQTDNNDSAYLFEGTLLDKAEALCASTTFARKLESVRDFVAASRRRETEREEEKRQHAEAELRATRDRLEAAREQQKITERHSAVLRRRDRILRAVLAVTVVVACVAVAAAFWARNSQQDAQQREQDATAQKLVAEAQARLADAREGDDLQALNELLAAHKLAKEPTDRPLLDALVNRFSMHKVLGIGEVPVIGVAFAGHRLAMAEPTAIRIWDTSVPGWHATLRDKGQLLTGGPASLTSMAISPDGLRVAAGDDAGNVQVWDIGQQNPVATLLGGKHEGRVTSVAFSRDGRIASAGVDGAVHISLPGDSGAPTSIATGSEIFSVAFSSSGGQLALGRADGQIQLLRVDGAVPLPGAVRESAHKDGVLSVAFSPDGRYLASGGADTKVRLWNATTLDPIREMPGRTATGELPGHTATVTSVAFNDDSKRIVSGSNDKTVQLWDVASGARIGDPMRGHGGLVLTVDFVADSNEIVSGGNEHTMRLWDADSGQPLSTPITSRTGPVTDVAVSPDGRQIASAGSDMTVRLWNADTGAEIDTMSQHKGLVTSVAFSPVDRVDRVVASASTDGTIRLWRLDTDAVTTYDAGQPLTAVEFNATGDRLAAAGVDGQVFLWNLTSGAKTLLENKDHAIVYGVAFDPKHDRLASVSVSGYLRMWGLADGEQLWQRDEAAVLSDAIRAKEKLAQGYPGSLISVAFSPDGERVASGGVDWTTAGGAVGFLQRWDADDGAPVGEPIKVGNAVMGIAFSPEPGASGGDQIVVASFDPYEVQLWNTDAPGAAKFIFADHQAQVVSVAVSQDGRRIVSGSADGSVRVWPNLPTGPADEAICAKLTSNMSDAEWGAWVSKEIPYQTTCPDNVVSDAQKPK